MSNRISDMCPCQICRQQNAVNQPLGSAQTQSFAAQQMSPQQVAQGIGQHYRDPQLPKPEHTSQTTVATLKFKINARIEQCRKLIDKCNSERDEAARELERLEATLKTIEGMHE